jgi:predicted TIM-barrel fold metal-dependent hydrolase
MNAGCRVDCHAHVITPGMFPYADGPGYKPRPDETGDFEAFRRVLASHEITHALLVQPSCYGYDNACMLDAMARSQGRFKGIAVVSPDATDNYLLSLKEKGIVGVRLHLVRSCPDALSRPESGAFLSRVKSLGWFVEVYAIRQMWADIVDPLQRSGVTVLIAHLGEPDVHGGLNQPGFQAVLRLGRETEAVVKLSAPFRVSSHPFPYEDLEPFVTALVDAFGVDRCVWGSDWPFLDVPQRVNYDNLLNSLARWLPDPGNRERVLWHNPVRLFGFADVA